MVVLIVECAAPALRGELSRWMVEPHPGVFVGSVSGMVRDKLWDKVTETMLQGGATLIHSSDTEQGFAVRNHGDTRREIVDSEGLKLVVMPVEEEGGPAKEG
jgi:CRISPR-associated protein Cas2